MSPPRHRCRQASAALLLALSRIPGLEVPRDRADTKTNWQSYCVLLPEGADQRAVMQSLLDEIGLDKRNDEGIRLLPSGRSATIVVEHSSDETEDADDDADFGTGLLVWWPLLQNEPRRLASGARCASAN